MRLLQIRRQSRIPASTTPINYKDETIHFDAEVVRGGNDYAMTDKLEDGDTIVPGSTIYVGLIDDGTGNNGPLSPLKSCPSVPPPRMSL